MERRFLTRSEAAQMLGLSPQTLANWAWRETGPPLIRLSARCLKYDRETLLAWMRQHQENRETMEAQGCEATVEPDGIVDQIMGEIGGRRCKEGDR